MMSGRGSAAIKEEVLACAEALAVKHAVTAEQARLLLTALQHLRAQADDFSFFIHLPLRICTAVRGDDFSATPLAAVTSLIFLGADILDDLADGDLPPCWEGTPASTVHLAAATLLCALPQAAIAGLNVAPELRVTMQRTLAHGLLRMAAGQERDLAFTGSAAVRPGEAEACAIAKSGGELALFAGLAAQFAGAQDEKTALYTRFGEALGTAAQISSDCQDLFQARVSCDFKNGTRTLPVALHLGRLEGSERVGFLSLLDEARRDEAAREEVRRRLRAAGDLRRAAVIVEIYCQQALRALHDAAPLEPGATGLREMIERVSFSPRRLGDRQKVSD